MECLGQPVDVDEVGQRCESHLGTLLSEFRDPLLFCWHGKGFRCTRHVSLQRCHDMASPSLHGVPRVVPPLQRYYGTLRLPAVRLDPFDFFTSRYHRFARGLLPSVVGVPPGAWELSVPVSHPDLRWKRRGLSGSLETLVVIVRALRPRQDQAG